MYFWGSVSLQIIERLSMPPTTVLDTGIDDVTWRSDTKKRVQDVQNCLTVRDKESRVVKEGHTDEPTHVTDT